MIAKALTQKDINTVLLKLYRKEKNCELIQGNVFYNLSLIDANYGKLSSALLNRYSQVTKYQNRIAALNALLYNKIYNLYEKAMRDINTYNSDVEAEAYWSNEYDNASDNEAAARRNKETAYSNYEAAQAEYTRISNDYDQRISAAQQQKYAKEARLAEKQSELANVEQLIQDFRLVSNGLLGSKIKFGNSDVYPLASSWTHPDTSAPWGISIDYDSVRQYIMDAQGTTNYFTLGSYTFTSAGGIWGLPIEYKLIPDSAGNFVAAAQFYSSGGSQAILLQREVTGFSNAQQVIADAVAAAINAIKADVDHYRNEISIEDIEAEIAQLESDISNLETQISNLRSEKTAALEAQQAVIDGYYNQYTYYKQQEEYYKNNKLIYKMKRDAARTRQEKSYEAAESSSGAYNDAKDEYEGEDKDLLPELPEPWGGMHSPDDEESDPQDGDSGGDQSDD